MPAARWNQITEKLRAAIDGGEFQPGDRLPTEHALAAQWKVSRPTANRAVQELQRLGLVMRQRGAGTVVAPRQSRRTGHIALVFERPDGSPQSELIHGLRSALPEEYHLLLCETLHDPAREARTLRRVQQEVDGIICWPTCAPQNTPLLRRILQDGTPVVCVDRVPEALAIDAVVTDNEGATLQALRTLLDRGHRRIAYFGDPIGDVSSRRERYAAYLQAMQEAHVPDPSHLVRWFPVPTDRELLTQVVRDALFTLLHQPDAPTAIFCMKDIFLGATLDACDQLELLVPQDLEVMSFTDWPLMTARLPRQVHRLVQRSQEIGRLAAGRLLERLHGETRPSEVQRLPADFYPAQAAVGKLSGERESTVHLAKRGTECNG